MTARVTAIAFLFCALACASPSSPSAQHTAAREPREGTAEPKKRLLASVRGEPRTFSIVEALPGGPELRQLVQSGLAVEDTQGVMRPQLAAQTPSVENGLWILHSDGTMETTWQIRPTATWHDGQPLTTDDLVFTTHVGQDKEVAFLGHVGYAFFDRAEALGERTLRVHWKQPYIYADAIFSTTFAAPLPHHRLLRAFNEDKAGFGELSYWSEEFLGSGPFRLQSWTRGSHLVLAAHQQYALGKPKIDEIEVRFVPDPNTLLANILANTVDLTLGRSLSLEQATLLRTQWAEGGVEIAFAGRIGIVPQFLNPNPPVIADARFRRALVHATDRQQLSDSLQIGLSSVAESYLNPNQPDYREVEAAIPRYPFDTRRAADLLGSLGYVRIGSGDFRDGSGQSLAVEIRTSAGDDLQEKSLFSVAGDWRRLGIEVEQVIVPSQRQQDREFRATRHGFELYRQPDDLPSLPDLHSSQTPTSNNGYTGRNRSRYQSAELDGLLERYFTTIPRVERIKVVGQIIYHISDQLTIMGLFYNTSPAVRSKRVSGASAAQNARVTWNAHEWDVVSRAS